MLLSAGTRVNFPVTELVEAQAEFWYLIFSRFHSYHAVIHDIDQPNLIIDVIDFSKFSKKYNQGKPYKKSDRKRIIDKYVARYERAMRKVRRAPNQVSWNSPMEKRILEVIVPMRLVLRIFVEPKHSFVCKRVWQMNSKLHPRARLYLPYMERIFRNHGLPTELTRIVFVESMFNPKALSKVGASGVWQFMPATAKDYMLVNHYVDERNSPLKATEAAARFLKYNYRKLKSWPLAVTAYNHGANGMARAARTTNSKDLSFIIRITSHLVSDSLVKIFMQNLSQLERSITIFMKNVKFTVKTL